MGGHEQISKQRACQGKAAAVTLLVTGLQGRKCRFGILRNTESTAGTLQGACSQWFCNLSQSTVSEWCTMCTIPLTLSLALSLYGQGRNVPLQGQLCHLEEGVLHRGAVDPRGWWPPERCPQRGLDICKGLVVVHRPRVPAPLLCLVRQNLAWTIAFCMQVLSDSNLVGNHPSEKRAASVKGSAVQRCMPTQRDTVYERSVKQGSENLVC